MNANPGETNTDSGCDAIGKVAAAGKMPLKNKYTMTEFKDYE